jgi:hypothetical protein
VFAEASYAQFRGDKGACVYNSEGGKGVYNWYGEGTFKRGTEEERRKMEIISE